MIVVWRTIGTRPGRYTVRNLQNDMQILAISFHSWPLFDSTCPRLSFLRSTPALPFWLYPFFFLSPRRATSWLVSCIMHALLLSTVSVGAVSRRTRLRQPAAAFSSRPRGRSFRRRSDTRWTIFADDDASMFHENHEGWRIHFVISIIYAATLPGCLEFFLLLRHHIDLPSGFYLSEWHRPFFPIFALFVWRDVVWNVVRSEGDRVYTNNLREYFYVVRFLLIAKVIQVRLMCLSSDDGEMFRRVGKICVFSNSIVSVEGRQSRQQRIDPLMQALFKVNLKT